MGWLVGKIHDTPIETGRYLSVDITKAEADEFFAAMVGKPALLDHDESKQIGHVMQVWLSKTWGAVLASLYIDEGVSLGRTLIQELKQNKKNGLSFGQLALVDERTGIRYSRSEPTEISVVEQGAVPQSRILAYGTQSQTHISSSGIVQLMEPEIAFNAAEFSAATILSWKKDAEELARLRKEEEQREVQSAISDIESWTEALGEEGPKLAQAVEIGLASSTKSTLQLVRIGASVSRNHAELKKKHEAATAELATLRAELEAAKKRDDVGFVKDSESTTAPLYKKLRMMQNGAEQKPIEGEAKAGILARLAF